MKGKEFLSRYVNIERRVKSKLEKAEEFKQRAVSLAREAGVKVQTSKQINGTQKIITEYMDMESEIVEEVKKLKLVLRNIQMAISRLQNEAEKEILEKKYINGDSFPQISQKMNMCERQIIRIHGKALEKIEKIINPLEK